MLIAENPTNGSEINPPPKSPQILSTELKQYKLLPIA